MILNYEVLQVAIESVEKVLDEYPEPERNIILRFVLERLHNQKVKSLQSENARTLVNDLLPKSLKGMFKKENEDD